MTSRVATTAEKIQIQFNLDGLVSWSEKWQMKFNVHKYKALHIGNINQIIQWMALNFPRLAMKKT